MDPQRELAQGLIRKARDDLAIAKLLVASAESPTWGIGFHLQQAAEKAIKAVLCTRAVVYPRTHSLSLLLDLLEEHGGSAPFERASLVPLTPFGTLFRYDDSGLEEAMPPDAAQVSWSARYGLVSDLITWAANAVTQ